MFHQCCQRAGEWDLVAITHYFDIALAPEAIWAADDQALTVRKQAQFEQGNRGLGFWCKIHDNQACAFERLKLPFHLATEQWVRDRLLPARIPGITARVQDGDLQMLIELYSSIAFQ